MERFSCTLRFVASMCSRQRATAGRRLARAIKSTISFEVRVLMSFELERTATEAQRHGGIQARKKVNSKLEARNSKLPLLEARNSKLLSGWKARTRVRNSAMKKYGTNWGFQISASRVIRTQR